jgi:hypothetical protein
MFDLGIISAIAGLVGIGAKELFAMLQKKLGEVQKDETTAWAIALVEASQNIAARSTW